MCCYDLPRIRQAQNQSGNAGVNTGPCASSLSNQFPQEARSCPSLPDQGKAPWCPQIIIVGWPEEQKPLLSVMVPTDLRPKPVVSHPSCILGSAGEFSKNIYSPGPALDKLTPNLWALACFQKCPRGLWPSRKDGTLCWPKAFSSSGGPEKACLSRCSGLAVRPELYALVKSRGHRDNLLLLNDLLQLLLDMQLLSSMAFSKLKKENFQVVLNNLYCVFFSSNFTWINFTNHKFIQLKHTIQYLLI